VELGKTSNLTAMDSYSSKMEATMWVHSQMVLHMAREGSSSAEAVITKDKSGTTSQREEEPSSTKHKITLTQANGSAIYPMAKANKYGKMGQYTEVSF